MNTRKEKALITKDKIYTSALKLIQENGYENVFIEDITNAAGIAKGSFYTHFSSKENLLCYTFQKVDIYYAQVYKKVKDKTDFFDMMSSFILLSYRKVGKLGKEILQALCVNLFTEESKSIFLDENRELYTALSNIIDYGKDSGVLNKNVPTHFYVVRISTFLVGIDNYWCLMNEDVDLSEFAEENVRLLVKGLSLL